MSLIAKKLVIAAIDYANPAPLMWDFEHPPLRDDLLQRYAIVSSTPAECAERLHAGTADVGLVPVAAYGSMPKAVIIPRCAIASLDHVQSILLVLRKAEGIGEVKRVALDTASLTSVAYTRIFFGKLWKASPEFVPHAPDLEAMLRIADAALLIGDPALLALKDREPRELRTGERLEYLDLAHEWRAWTGTPWISAFWAVREEAFSRQTATKAQVVQDFERSRDHGLAHINDLAEELSARMPLSAAELQSYFRKNIYYFLDDQCLGGLELFYRYAVECGALESIPKLRFL
ncbi:MAG TPA: menaquinone biosynthesis protein [Silvibacterium sp.]|nr:menaquinone biosynthesis protein [Silvibacterium sp.]